jgi:hypothetical protein
MNRDGENVDNPQNIQNPQNLLNKIVRTCSFCEQCRELTKKEDVEEDEEMIFDCIFCNQPPLSATVRKYFKCNHIMCKHCFSKYLKFECPVCKSKHY